MNTDLQRLEILRHLSYILATNRDLLQYKIDSVDSGKHKSKNAYRAIYINIREHSNRTSDASKLLCYIQIREHGIMCNRYIDNELVRTIDIKYQDPECFNRVVDFIKNKYIIGE